MESICVTVQRPYWVQHPLFGRVLSSQVGMYEDWIQIHGESRAQEMMRSLLAELRIEGATWDGQRW